MASSFPVASPETATAVQKARLRVVLEKRDGMITILSGSDYFALASAERWRR